MDPGQPSHSQPSERNIADAAPLLPARLRALAPGWPAIECVAVTGSTSDDLLDRARSQPVHGIARFADVQTAGRGRRGRDWVSPPVGNIYLSVAWQFPGGAGVLEGLSLAVGAAVAECLDAELGTALALKWPNDLYLADRKVGGMLVDIAPMAESGVTAVVGIGLNLFLPPTLAGGIDQPVTSLAKHIASPPDRTRIAGGLLRALLPLLTDWERAGFAPWRQRWQARDWLWQHPLAVSGSEQFSGVGQGVDARGNLLVATDGGIRRVAAGEVSVRPKAGES